MPLTDEMKREIINYCLPEGDFSKGLIEDDGPTGMAYGDTVNSDDIYEFINECRQKLLSGLSYEK